MTTLKFKINELKNKKNEFLTLTNENKINRSIASVIPVNPDNDLVEFHVYRWSPQQLLSSGEGISRWRFRKIISVFQDPGFQFPRHQVIFLMRFSISLELALMKVETTWIGPKIHLQKLFKCTHTLKLL